MLDSTSSQTRMGCVITIVIWLGFIGVFWVKNFPNTPKEGANGTFILWEFIPWALISFPVILLGVFLLIALVDVVTKAILVIWRLMARK